MRVGAVKRPYAVVALVDDVEPVILAVLGGDEHLIRGHADTLAARGQPDALDLHKPLLAPSTGMKVVSASFHVNIADGEALQAQLLGDHVATNPFTIGFRGVDGRSCGSDTGPSETARLADENLAHLPQVRQALRSHLPEASAFGNAGVAVRD